MYQKSNIPKSTKKKELTFRFEKDELGGIDSTSGTPVYTVTLLEILQRFNVSKVIDYFSLDVEGTFCFRCNGSAKRKNQ